MAHKMKIGNGLQAGKKHGPCARTRTAAHASLVGKVAPSFTANAVYDQEIIRVSLDEYIGKKYIVLFFYPLDFTFVCPTEVTAFSDRYNEFAELNAEILGVSVDSEFCHLAWTQTDRREGGVGELEFPIVSDLKRTISSSYDVLTDDGVALRGLFIIDLEGVVQHVTINNLAFGRNVDEVKRSLQAIQYVKNHPDEVCPAGWQPGERTMKEDVQVCLFSVIACSNGDVLCSTYPMSKIHTPKPRTCSVLCVLLMYCRAQKSFLRRFSAFYRTSSHPHLIFALSCLHLSVLKS